MGLDGHADDYILSAEWESSPKLNRDVIHSRSRGEEIEKVTFTRKHSWLVSGQVSSLELPSLLILTEAASFVQKQSTD